MLRIPAIALACILLLLAGAAAGPLLLPDMRLPGTNLGERLFYWDACWYDEISGIGYQWARFTGPASGHYSDVAFFPLYALVDHGFIWLTGRSGAAYMLVPGLVLGFWSILAFYRLAEVVTTVRAARWGTLCFALWPGACFLVMGYPTGLINLCVVKALHNTVMGRRWRGAAWCGIGTAAGPTVVFVAAALCLDRAWGWERANWPRREVPGLLAYGLLSVAGLLAFMGYLTARFGHPLLFVTAQEAWMTPMPFRQHLARAANPVWYGAVARQSAAGLRQFLTHGPRGAAAAQLAVFQYQQLLTVLVLLLAIGALIYASWRGRSGVLAPAGWLVVAGYLWFMGSTSAFLVDGPRMIYPAVAVMLVAGVWAAESRVARWLLVGGFAVLSCFEAALASAGYPVN